jgi:DNA polymerase III epsilon subunit-like protein
VTGLDRPWDEASWDEACWAVVDVEGNGQRPPDLVEAACLPIDAGQPGQLRAWLVRPPRPITALVTRIHGIRTADVADMPAVAEVAEDIRAALAGRVVVGHQVSVDASVLRRELPGWTPLATVDTVRLARTVWPGLPAYSLDALAEHAGLRTAGTVAQRHRAGYDTELTAALFLVLARDAAAGCGELSVAQLVALAGRRRSGGRAGRLF